MSRGDFGSGARSQDVHINIERGFDSHNDYSSNGDSEYIRLSNCVSNNIQQLTKKVASIQRMVKNIGTNFDVPELFEQLQNEQKNANNIANETSVYFKQLRQIQSSPTEARQRKIQQDKLQENFSIVLNNFQQVQRLVVEKEREKVHKARTKSLEHGFQNYEHHDTSPMKGNENTGYSLQAQEEADVNIDMIREREDALRQLESDIVNVNEIFKDLAIMVHEQGETIDSIEANVDHTHQHVEQANIQLQKAKTHQSAARKKKCCLIVILLLAIIGLAIAIYFGSK